MAVGGHLVAGTQLHQIPEHHCRGGDLRQFPVSDNPGGRCVQKCQLVEFSFRRIFLGDPNSGIDDQDHAEKTIGNGSGQHNQHKKGTEDRIEPGQRVTSDNLPAGARGCIAGGVDLPGGYPIADPRGAESEIVIRAGSGIWEYGRALGVGHNRFRPWAAGVRRKPASSTSSHAPPMSQLPRTSLKKWTPRISRLTRPLLPAKPRPPTAAPSLGRALRAAAEAVPPRSRPSN